MKDAAGNSMFLKKQTYLHQCFENRCACIQLALYKFAINRVKVSL